MGTLINITSASQLQELFATKQAVLVAFYRTPGRTINVFEIVATQPLPRSIAIAKCHLDQNSTIAAGYGITQDPTVLQVSGGNVIAKLQGEKEIGDSFQSIMAGLQGGAGGKDAAGPSAGGAAAESAKGWRGAPVAKGFMDVTQSIEIKELDIMNSDSEFGGVRTLVEPSKPSGLSKDKAAEGADKDWVESDTDEQLMLFMRFQTAAKLHSIHITSLPPPVDDDADDEAPSRPSTIKLFVNTPQILGFEDANEREATQTVQLTEKDWDAKTGTAVIQTRFVKFQNVSALTVFFEAVEREGGERVRLDRVRVIGETIGEKVDMAKLKAQEE